MNFFDYNDGLNITKGAFRISASQLSKFFDSTSQWYREHLLGESGFEGSTSSHLGNCIHAAAAMYFHKQPTDHAAIAQYIHSITSPDVDKSLIFEQYPPMVEALTSQFLSSTRLTESETFLWQEILPGIGVGGSADAYDSHLGVIYDFKSTSSKTPPTSFSRAYWFQLMTYAWLYRKAGKKADYIELVYVTRNETNRISETTGKPLKDYPSTVYRLREVVTPENLALIEGCINLIAESVQHWQQHPEHQYLLAQDYRLKSATKVTPILFKD